MKSSGLGVGIIGPGAIAAVHARAVLALGHHVAAVAGPDRRQADAFGNTFSCPRVYDRAEQLVADDTVDAVIVASPNRLHVEHTELALKAGRPVLSEVPVATSLPAALGLQATAAAADQWVMVAHTLRYLEGPRKLRELVESEGFQIAHLSARRLLRRQTNTGWTGQPRAWTDQIWWHHGAHLLDATLWLLDTTSVEISGRLGGKWARTGEPMDAAAVLSTMDGRLAGLTLSYHSQLPVDEFVAINENHTYLLREGRLVNGDSTVTPTGLSPADELEAAVRVQDAAFLQAVANRTRPPIELADVMPTIRLLQHVQDDADLQQSQGCERADAAL
ncbi:hypothetical protein GCM10009804_70860 [Kribbella hippodromi]|uniref:Gfo/Idh/MocA family oxidoreductase n=1 Tax=Kribbella hippodromi TaxID=434347 RepID=A0ABP4QAT1_9ACTN